MIRTHAGDSAAWLSRHQGQRPVFACILSFTETGLIPNISAAGTTPQARQYTALADAEWLFKGGNRRRYPLTQLTAGISPSVISRAVLRQQNIPVHLLSTGLPHKLSLPHIALPQVIAQSLHTGKAMNSAQVEALLQSGLDWGHKLAKQGSYLLIGECVVGGTTTAQALLTALGYSVQGSISSSHRQSNHRQKQALVEQGMIAWQKRSEAANRNALHKGALGRRDRSISPLAAVTAIGDPMQIVAAGMAIAASRYSGVLLAGGAQMLAVYALAQALARSEISAYSWQREQVVVGTTRWVIEDSSADTVKIAQAIGAPYLASQINFSQSPYFQLRAYELGFIKEGMGAGGCAIAAHLYRTWTKSQLRHAVETELRICL